MIYEVMYIIPSKYSETEVEGVSTTVNALFTKHGAELQKSENLGKIKLAYPIKKEKYGTFILNFIEVPGENLIKLDQDFRLSEEVLRHIIVKREKGIPATFNKPESYVAPLNSEGKRTAGLAAEADKPKPQAKSGKKLSTEALDKKLDEILESDITKDI